MDVVSTDLTNTIPTNVKNTIPTNATSTVLTNVYKKLRSKMDSYMFHTVLLAIILLLMITIICFPYAKHRSKLKNILSC